MKGQHDNGRLRTSVDFRNVPVIGGAETLRRDFREIEKAAIAYCNCNCNCL